MKYFIYNPEDKAASGNEHILNTEEQQKIINAENDDENVEINPHKKEIDKPEIDRPETVPPDGEGDDEDDIKKKEIKA